MKASFVLICCIALVGCKANVDAPTSPNFDQKANVAISDWGACQGREKLKLVNSTISSEAASENALLACSEYEENLKKVYASEYGIKNAAAEISTYREHFRITGIKRIEQLRGGPAVEDPSFEWGGCLGTQLRNPDNGQEKISVQVDNAFGDCADFEKTLYDKTKQKYGLETATKHTAEVKAQLRRQAINALESQAE
jgi:hypothetical protein